MVEEKDKFKDMLKRIVKGIVSILVLFVLINMLIFIPLIVNQLKSPRHPEAKAYLKSAFMINQMYIFPLSNALGYRNRLTLPFYTLRDRFYQTGMSKLDNDEGEKEIWWFDIRFFEYKMLIQKTLFDAYQHKTGYIPLPKWQEKIFKDCINELYSHIQSWPKAKIDDAAIKKEKLIRFLDMAETYISSINVLSSKLQITAKDYKPEEHKHHKPYPKLVDVKNYMNVVDTFEKLKSDSAKNDKESYEYFEKNKGNDEEKFLYKSSLYLIGSENQWGKGVTCSSPEVNILASNHRKLRDYYVKNEDKLDAGESIGLSILITGPIKIPICNNIPETIEYEKFRQKYADYIYKKVKYNNLTELFK